MYYEGMEWSVATSATMGGTEYFGTAQERTDAEPSHLCPDLLYRFAVLIQAYFSLNMVWKGRLT